MDESNNLRNTISDTMSDSENIKNFEEKVEKITPTEEKPVEVKTETKVEQQEEEEVFSRRIDTKGKTPEELEKIYEGYNRAYTQKRQKEKEEIRLLKEQLDELKKPTQVIDGKKEVIAPELQREKIQAKHDLDLGKLSPQEYADRLIKINEESARRIAKEEFNSLYIQKADEDYQNKALSDFNTLDDRFDPKYINPDSPEFNENNAWMYQEVAEKMAKALDEHIAKNGSSIGFDTKKYANEFINAFDSRIDKIVKTRVKTTTQTAREKANRFQKSSPAGTTTNSFSEGAKNLREHIEKSMS